ncbi:MAG: ABC transporter permease [Bacteroidia bacterium]
MAINSAPITVKFSFAIVLLFTIVGGLAKYIANDVPFYLEYQGESYYPLFSGKKVLAINDNNAVKINYLALQKVKGVYAVYPLVPFKAKGANINSSDYQKPLSHINGRIHVLGTNQVGEDTLAGIIHGAAFSVKVGVGAMLLALIIGLSVGTTSGYLGNKGLAANGLQIIGFLIFQIPIYFYVFVLPKYSFISALELGMGAFAQKVIIALLAIVIIETALIFGLRLLPKYNLKSYNLPFDNLVGRFIEFIDGLPMLMILIALSVIFKPSASFLIVFIGGTSWISIARLSRAEVLKIRQSDFINAARLMKMPTWRIIIKHLLPNAMGPVTVAFAFGVGNAILAESSLSFLGIGLPNDVKTWGMIIDESRQYYKAWWLMWSPGICITLIILSFYNIGQFLRSKFNPEGVVV